jgi:NAD-specific glutamate dehydrogenase
LGIIQCGLIRKVERLTENSVGGVHVGLVLGGITNKPLILSEGDAGRSCAVALVIGDDLNAVVLPHSHARVGCAEIDPDGRGIVPPRSHQQKT